MKLSLLSLILSASLAVSAAPLRVVVVSEQAGPPSFIRFGHAVAHKGPNFEPHVAVLPVVSGGRVVKHKGCAGSLRLKALQVSNWFKGLVGIPVYKVAIMNPVPVNVKPVAMDTVDKKKIHFIQHHHHVHGQHLKRPKVFFQRLTHALMMLGPWEGRIVSFVLGCGISVLLRIVWVLAVLAIRSVRGKKQADEFLADEVIFEEQEHLLPPQYTEAVQDVEEKVKTEPVAATATATATPTA